MALSHRVGAPDLDLDTMVVARVPRPAHGIAAGPCGNRRSACAGSSREVTLEGLVREDAITAAVDEEDALLHRGQDQAAHFAVARAASRLDRERSRGLVGVVRGERAAARIARIATTRCDTDR